MKRIVVSLLILIATASVAQAADLKAGWYVNIDTVDVYSYMAGSGQVYLRSESSFSDTPGEYGPFLVTNPSTMFNTRRNISVLNDVDGVSPDQSLVLPMMFGFVPGDRIAYFSVAIGTNYDSSQMWLQLWRKHVEGTPDELVWENTQSGPGGFSGHIANNTIYTGQYYFKVNVVPEPSGPACLLLGVVPLISLVRRRRK